jgi:hypothetical protein
MTITLSLDDLRAGLGFDVDRFAVAEFRPALNVFYVSLFQQPGDAAGLAGRQCRLSS